MPRILFVAVLLAVVGGCAQKRNDNVLPPPPTEDQRAGFGTVGLTSVRFTPGISFRLPAKGSGEGAERGAVLGAAVPIAVGTATLNPYGMMAGIVLSPVGLVYGTVYGATKALPAEEVEKAEAVLKGALSPRHIETAMADAMREFMRREAKLPVVFAKGLEGRAHSGGASLGAGTGRWVDTMVELKVTMVGLTGPWSINPPLSFTMRMATKVIRVADGTELHAQQLTYLGPAMVFTAWAANEAEAFKKALDPAVRALAEKAVEEVFLLYLPDVKGVAG
ncbi:MAG: hypothetical protein O7A66_12060 [Alphaproteobacteria bacterium]|nr:hypothetical protein [Alphaproteobacteria bacterium]